MIVCGAVVWRAHYPESCWLHARGPALSIVTGGGMKSDRVTIVAAWRPTIEMPVSSLPSRRVP